MGLLQSLCVHYCQMIPITASHHIEDKKSSTAMFSAFEIVDGNAAFCLTVFGISSDTVIILFRTHGENPKNSLLDTESFLRFIAHISGDQLSLFVLNRPLETLKLFQDK